MALFSVTPIQAAFRPYQATIWEADIHLPAAQYRAFKPIATKGNFMVTLDPGTYLDGVTVGVPAAGQQKWIGKGGVLGTP